MLFSLPLYTWFYVPLFSCNYVFAFQVVCTGFPLVILQEHVLICDQPLTPFADNKGPLP